MKILIFGQDKDYTLGNLCARSLERLGHKVRFIDNGTLTIPIVGVEWGASRVRERFIKEVSNHCYDIVLIIKGNKLRRRDIIEAKSNTDGIVCNWNPDNPFMARSKKRRLKNYMKSLPEYDTIFIWTRELIDRLKECGATNVNHLPFAYDPLYHRSVLPDKSFKSDVVFIGHWSPKRQRYLSVLTDLDYELAIYGNYWRKKCLNIELQKCIRGSAVYGKKYCKALCSSKVAINIVADHNLDAYNMKTFEIPATKSFMITSRTTEQKKIYGEGYGIECFGSPTELRTKAEKYLEDDESRRNISENGFVKVKEHTYSRRMKRLIDVVGRKK